MPRFPLLLCLAILAGAEEATETMTLTLDEALRLAHVQGRSMITQREDQDLEEQAYANVLRDYGPQPSASLGTRLGGTGAGGAEQRTTSATVAVRQDLPTGGSATVSGQATRTDDGAAASTTGSATVSVEQPLLRGAGLLVWREALTRAERAREHRLRGFASFRENLSLDTARTFWELQRQQAAVAAARQALDSARFTLDQSRALMSIGKTNANDVFRAETNLLQASQAVIDEDAALQAAEDNFKLELAIDPGRVLRIDSQPPVFRRLRIDAAAALDAAFAHRRDLANARDEVADAERAHRLARRDLLPSLAASAAWTWTGALDDGAKGWRDPPAWSLGLDLDIPLDQRNEHLALERARIALLRVRRDEAQLRERTVAEVRDGVRRLRNAEHSLTIQERNRLQTERRAEKAELDFRAGSAGNRDLVEAQNEVRAADDARYAALVGYLIAELTLRRDTGTLVVREDGGWDPEPPPYARLDAGEPTP